MFLQTCTPGAGCGGFSIACKRRKRPDGFLIFTVKIAGSRKQALHHSIRTSSCFRASMYITMALVRFQSLHTHPAGDRRRGPEAGLFCPLMPGPKATALGSFWRRCLRPWNKPLSLSPAPGGTGRSALLPPGFSGSMTQGGLSRLQSRIHRVSPGLYHLYQCFTPAVTG